MNRAAALALLAACGRFDFDGRTDASTVPGDASRPDVAADTQSLAIIHVKPFAQRHPGAGSTDSFTVQAAAQGNFIAMQVGCSDSTSAATAVSVGAPGWTIVPISALANQGQLYAEAVYAIAPNAAPASITVTWTGADCDVGTSVLADEFTNTDPDPSGAAVDGANFAGGSANCDALVMPANANAAIWAACFATNALGGIGPGYQAGANNGGGDLAEYKITTDPAQTTEEATLFNAGDFLISVIAIKPR